MLKSLCTLTALSLVGACSHHQPKTTKQPQQISKSFLDVIKTKKPGKPQEDKRIPASAKSKPGAQEFIAALRANPNFLKTPVGFEVTKRSTGTYDGQPWESEEKSVYVREDDHGYFTLETYAGEAQTFNLYPTQSLSTIEKEILSSPQIKSFKKLSATKFDMHFEMPSSDFPGSCIFSLDLTLSSEVQGISCKDQAGNVVNETKIVSVVPIKIQDYASSLKAVKLEVFPKSLDCQYDGPDNACFSSVTDGEQRDWSYLLK